MPPPTHLPPWRTFSIFISSTFLDMQTERDHLKNIVFPIVEEELNKKRIRLEIVDLRWGVNTDDIVDEGEREKEVLKVVLDEIKRCRPFFIGLLGNRYGWVPPEERMKAVVEKEGLSIQNKDKSVTALEIEFGVLASKEQLDRSVFYFREPLDYAQMSANKAARYSDAHDPELSADEKALRIKALDDLKSTIKDHFEKQKQSEKVKSYTAGWDPDKEKVIRLEPWGEIVKKDILQECARHAQDTWDQVPQNWIEQEEALLDTFIERHTHETAREVDGQIEIIPTFCGRTDLLTDLKGHLLSHKAGPWGLVLTGESGSGKSAVFSMLCKVMQKEDCLILAHSAGLSVKSKSVASLLEIWNKQLGDFLEIEEKPDLDADKNPDQSLRYPGTPGEKPATGIEILQATFRERLFMAAEKKHVILLIDALDRFESTPRAQYLSWLPDVMPPNIYGLCTAITGTEKKAIEYHKGLTSRNIDLFSPAEALSMLETLCRQAHKTLPEQVKKIILEKNIDNNRLACSSPLWLSLAVNILMAMDQDDFEKINQSISNEKQAMAKYLEEMALKFPSLPGPLFIDLIKKAGSVFGHEFTTAVFDFTACSRYGLREKDLEVLLTDMDVSGDPLVFANLRRWFRSHFVIQGEDQQWDLAHSILRAALLSHAGDQLKRDIHILIADHLLELDQDPLKSNEVMYHLLQAGMHQVAAMYYGSALTKEESAGSTEVLAEIILNEAAGVDKVSSLPGLITGDDQQFYGISHKYTFELSSYLETEGNLNHRLFLLNQLKDQIDNKFKIDLPNSDFGYDYCALIEKLGATHQALGQFDQALEYFEKDITLFKELYEANPKSENLKNGLAVSYSRLGDIHQALGQFDQALEYFEKQIILFKEFYEANPKSENLKNGLAVSYSKLGAIYQALGQFDQALEYFEKFNQLTTEVYEANPKSEDLKDNLAISYEKLGEIHQALGQFDQALEYFEKRTQIGKELYEANPKSENLKNGLAISYEKLGDIHQDLGQFDQALEYFEKRTQIGKELYEANPKSENLKNGLAISYSKLGDIHRALGQFDQALEYFEKQITLFKELYIANPKSENLKNGLAVSYSRLGDIHQALGQFDQALEYFEKQTQIGKDLYEANPKSENLKDGLAISYEKLGAIYQALGQFDQALEYFEKRTQIGKELYEANPKSENLKNGLAISYYKLGGIYQALGQFDQALEYFEKQIILFKELYEANPKSENLKNGLAVSYSRLGDIHQALGQFDQALEYFEKRTQIGKELYEANPKSENLKNGLAVSYSKLGDIHQALGQFDQALEYFEKRTQIGKELYEANPKSIQLLEGLAVSYYKLGDLSMTTGQKETGKEYLKEFVRICNILYQTTKLGKYKQWLDMVKQKYGIVP